jgi:uronate dehydrogenase
MAQLVTIGIEQPDLRFEIVYGISDNARTWFDNANAHRLGYRPQDQSETYAEEMLKRAGPPGTSPADIYQGGGHCMSEGGTRSRLAGAPDAPPRTKRPASRAKKAASKSPAASVRNRRRS